jgi:branched-chain amino acid aminotransferase
MRARHGRGAPVTTAAIKVERVSASRRAAFDATPPPFGAVASDHMLVASFHDGAWREAAVRPYGPIEVVPSISALQYGVSVFEGLKAERGPRGEVLLFRARDNARRMRRSAERLAMPPVPEQLFLDGLQALLEVDERWVPDAGAGALYIRPCLFSVDPSVRVRPAERFLFVIFTCPFGAYYDAPVDVLVGERYVRAFRGGTGDVKPAGNYAPAMLADREAQAEGCHTTLWLDGIERRFVEECGVMNAFFVLGDAIVTPPLGGTILPGITRDSVVTLLRDAGARVAERPVAIDELVAAHGRGELREAFGTGTAATVTHIGRIRHRGRDLLLPPVESRRVGPSVREALCAIAAGRGPDPHGWVTIACSPGAASTAGSRAALPGEA